MAEYIDRDSLLKKLDELRDKLFAEDFGENRAGGCAVAMDAVRNVPAANVVPVHRCRDCIYFEPEHVETPSGEKKAYSEMPACAFDDLGTGLVTSEYGINVGSQCTVDENAVHSVSKAVWRRPDDFCSRWHGAKMDEATKDG